MGISLTIESLSPQVLERLQAEARQRGVDLNAVVKQLLDEAVGPVTAVSAAAPYHDLDALAGTWSEEETKAFLATVAAFARVDEDLWK